jgi:hypothetical protein
VLDGKDRAARGERLSSHRFVINGDDAMLVSPHESIADVWACVCRSIGFRPSPGKVFISRKYANINSRGFDIAGARLTTIGFLNMGLVMGMDRSGGGGGSSRGTEYVPGKDKLAEITVASRFNEMVSLLLGLTRPQLHYTLQTLDECCIVRLARDRFVRRNAKQCEEFAGIPWFAPKDTGGTGFACVSAVLSADLTLAQLREGGFIREGEVPDVLFEPWFEALCQGDAVPLERLSPTRLDLRAGLWIRRNLVERRSPLGCPKNIRVPTVFNCRGLWDKRRCRIEYVDHDHAEDEPEDGIETRLDSLLMLLCSDGSETDEDRVEARNRKSLRSNRLLWERSLTFSVTSRSARLFERFWEGKRLTEGNIVQQAQRRIGGHTLIGTYNPAAPLCAPNACPVITGAS